LAELADALTTGVVVADRTEPDHWLVIGDVTVAVTALCGPKGRRPDGHALMRWW